jgi:hypothetical protein
MRRAPLQTLLVLAVLAVAAGPARADYSRGGAFRTPGYGARPWGMAGAAVATVDDESAVYWNPAMLAGLRGNTVGASYVNLVQGTTSQQSQLAYAHVLARNEVEGGTASARHVVGLLYTNLNLGIGDANNYDENLLRLVYAFTPERFVSVGISLEAFYSTSDVDNFGGLGTAVDGSARLQLTEHATLALVVRDAFSRYSYEDGADFSKERSWTVGLGYAGLPFLSIEGDAIYDHGGISRLLAGAETHYILGHLALRGGVSSMRAGTARNVLHGGLSVRAVDERLYLHYNYNMDEASAFEDTHRFTLSFVL